jgi:hypothetical protein
VLRGRGIVQRAQNLRQLSRAEFARSAGAM